MGQQLRVVVRRRVDHIFFDLDIGVQLRVLVIEPGLLETHDAVRADRHDRLALAVTAAGRAGGSIVAVVGAAAEQSGS
ncbi:hypothetical protein ACFQ2Y_19615 [Streptomyces malaysiensis subsp. malaysiensis]